jgi:Flp pilus assembly CpaF family ATPase
MVLRFDHSCNEISIASAGHVPPWIIEANNAHRLPIHGPLCGMVTDPAYREILVTLQPHQRLLIKTDGIQLTVPLVNMMADQTSKAIAEEIMTHYASPNDDATLIVIDPPTML